jgi:hypothetical protein
MHRDCLQIERQIAHWIAAVERLDHPESWASVEAWRSLENYLGLTLRQSFVLAIHRLRHHATQLRNQFNAAQSSAELDRVRQRLLMFRSEFIRTETMLDFFGDAIKTRTSEKMSALLRACDILAQMSIRQMLEQFDKKTPPVLAYLDKGLGASILKAGLRLWDGITLNPVATIKIVRHNLARPTSLIHEAGHQAAHQLDWNNELAAALASRLKKAPLELIETWSGWASEIAADVFAFVHTGYASVAALHDVLAGERELIFALRPLDPHPVNFIRVLLCVEFCRLCYGRGPWDDLATAWMETHPLKNAPGESRELLSQSIPLLPMISEVCLSKPLKGFNGKTIMQCIDPQRVSPSKLAELEKLGGAALYTSTQWANTEALRITAWTGYRSAVQPSESEKYWQRQEQLMLLLGGMTRQPKKMQYVERRAEIYG